MSVFNPLHVGQYDQLYSKKNYLGVCAFLEAAVECYAGYAPITLVVSGCGTGTSAIELACLGYKVTGIHFSQLIDNHVSIMLTTGFSGGKGFPVFDGMYPRNSYIPSGLASTGEKIDRVAKAVWEVLG